MNFHQLHHQSDLLLLCNVWDAASARAAEKSGFQAIGTSSAAIATQLGYDDGEQMRFGELLTIVARIAQSTALPLSVDMEAGYSRQADEVVEHITALVDLGVVGVNIEDSVVAGQRQLVDAESFADFVATVQSRLQAENRPVFLNVRTDCFLLGTANAQSETLRRVRLYCDAGADGIFVPCIERESDIQRVVEASTVPVNVMCMPNLPAFSVLKTLGVRRISMGNFVFDAMLKQLEQRFEAIITQQSFAAVFDHAHY